MSQNLSIPRGEARVIWRQMVQFVGYSIRCFLRFAPFLQFSPRKLLAIPSGRRIRVKISSSSLSSFFFFFFLGVNKIGQAERNLSEALSQSSRRFCDPSRSRKNPTRAINAFNGPARINNRRAGRRIIKNKTSSRASYSGIYLLLLEFRDINSKSLWIALSIYQHGRSF